MHFFESLIQYNSNGPIKTKMMGEDKINPEGIRAGSFYSKIYTLNVGDKTYYLAIGNGIYSGISGSKSIQAFIIENGKINDEVKLFKTKNKFLNKIEVEYGSQVLSENKISNNTIERESDLIEYNEKNKTLYVALVLESGRATTKNIIYRLKDGYLTFDGIK